MVKEPIKTEEDRRWAIATLAILEMISDMVQSRGGMLAVGRGPGALQGGGGASKLSTPERRLA